MAYYAELKRRCWHRINGGNAILWYKKKLYDDWYNSLTEEEKDKLAREWTLRHEADLRKAEELLSFLGRVYSMLPCGSDFRF